MSTTARFGAVAMRSGCNRLALGRAAYQTEFSVMYSFLRDDGVNGNVGVIVDFGVTTHAISFHMRRIYEKLQVHSKSEVVAKALKNRLV